MVAISINPQSPTGLTPDPSVRRMGYGPVRFTIGEVLEMLRQAILPEDATVELLDGSLVYRDRFDLRGSRIVDGVKHTFVIAALEQLGSRINNGQRHLRTQCTLICRETHAPVPDALVLRGTLGDYRQRLPGAADAFCVIEVADSSYERDAGEKLIGYAKTGIPQYVIVNLRNRTAEVYTNPDPSAGTYPPPRIIAESEALLLAVGEAEFVDVPLSELLP